jgi:hypothetical protein
MSSSISPLGICQASTMAHARISIFKKNNEDDADFLADDDDDDDEYYG